MNTSWYPSLGYTKIIPLSGILAEVDCRMGGERFWGKSRLETTEILCVFQDFRNDELRQKIR